MELLGIEEGGTPAVPAGAHQRAPEVTQEDRDALNDALDRGIEKEVGELESEFAGYIGRRYCLATGTGTAAVHSALVAAGVSGGEVPVGALGMSASALAIVHAGARPRFADIDRRTFVMSAETARPVINADTAAIMPVYIHGNPGDLAALCALGAERDKPIVPDAAQGYGAKCGGRHAAAFGTAAGVSVSPSKHIMGYVGGLFVCDDLAALKAAQRLGHYGEDYCQVGPDQTRAYVSGTIGWHYRVNPLGVPFVRNRLRHLPEYTDQARRNFARLTHALEGLPGIELPYVEPDCESAYWGLRIRLHPERWGWHGRPIELRDRMIRGARGERIPADTWQILPLPAHPAFRRRELRPWTPNTRREPLLPWHPELYPNTIDALSTSIVIPDRDNPLWLQPVSVMDDWARGLWKLWNRRDVLLSGPYEPLTPVGVAQVDDYDMPWFTADDLALFYDLSLI